VKRYRKVPVEIEAVQWDGTPEGAAQIVEWAGSDTITPMRVAVSGSRYNTRYDEVLHVGSLEGLVLARPGWWIIKGVHGEFYPCEPSIFAETYEAV
jgi:hypothetical protein